MLPSPPSLAQTSGNTEFSSGAQGQRQRSTQTWISLLRNEKRENVVSESH